MIGIWPAVKNVNPLCNTLKWHSYSAKHQDETLCECKRHTQIPHQMSMWNTKRTDWNLHLARSIKPLQKVSSYSGISIRTWIAAVIWLISRAILQSTPLVVPLSAPNHCLHLSPPAPHLSFLPNSFPWLCLAAHTEPDCTPFPELIGVTLAWQETQCHYGNAQSITGQRVNTLSFIFDYHICISLMVAMHGCYLLRGILSASSRRTSSICLRSAVSLLGCSE